MSVTKLSDPIEIAGIALKNRVMLAPMSGVTDVPFRNLASRFGAGLVVSEMVASQALLEGEAEMRFKIAASEAPVHMVQLAGREAKWMELAARMVADMGANIIDINMGCPAKRVTTGYSGSALMRDLDHALRLVEATVKATSVPVTLKMRLGWDDNSVNAPELAKRAQAAGIHMITVHARTRCQFYKGEADWKRVMAVREATKLPLIINGDISSHDTACQALRESGADMVMIGRGAYGRPWQPGLVADSIDLPSSIRLQHDPEIVLEHHETMMRFYGKQSGIRQARKHLGWYFDRLGARAGDVALRRKILTSHDITEIHRSIRSLFCRIAECVDQNPNRQAA